MSPARGGIARSRRRSRTLSGGRRPALAGLTACGLVLRLRELANILEMSPHIIYET